MSTDWPRRILLYAPGSFRGGGRAILTELCKGLRAGRDVLFADRRLQAVPENITVEPIGNTPLERLGAEFRLRRIARTGDLLICLNSLPPLLASKVPTVVYFQNVEILASPRLKYRILRQLFRWSYRRRYRVLCQTMPVAAQLQDFGIPAHPRPFVTDGLEVPAKVTPLGTSRTRLVFFYPSQPHSHKNHARLLAGWQTAVQAAPLPLTLRLTLNTDAEVLAGLDLAQLGIEPIGWLRADEMASAYAAADALIFPSYSETIGLPILEAHAAGLPVLASELPFARAFVEPWGFFDPHDAGSISDAILALCTATQTASAAQRPPDLRILKLPSGPEFLNQLIEEMC